MMYLRETVKRWPKKRQGLVLIRSLLCAGRLLLSYAQHLTDISGDSSHREQVY